MPATIPVMENHKQTRISSISRKRNESFSANTPSPWQKQQRPRKLTTDHKTFFMKQLVVIKSVQSRVRYEESEVQRIINKQVGNNWWRFRKRCKTTAIIDGFATFSTVSVTVPLRGMIEIVFLATRGEITYLQVPSTTHFVATFIERKNHFTPVLSVSLS